MTVSVYNGGTGDNLHVFEPWRKYHSNAVIISIECADVKENIRTLVEFSRSGLPIDQKYITALDKEYFMSGDVFCINDYLFVDVSYIVRRDS
jgi:hypothetical protein